MTPDELTPLVDLPLDGIIAAPQGDAHRCTLVLLHGYGAHAGDLLGLRDTIDPSLRCIALQAPHDLGPMGMPGGRAWFHLNMTPEGDIAYDTPGALSSLAQLADVIPAAVAQAGGNDTIVLGFSQGAMLGHGLLLKHQLPVAGLAACSGRLVPEVFDVSPLPVPAGTPVFLSHGTHDPVIPVTSGHAIRDAYTSDGNADVTWVEEPVAHGIGPEAMAGLQRWCAALR
ncbi:MAG: hypothetical protein MK101_12545 [Phycisphaerales bacterium]|nr:hypothetical protein [Phycisphaerales bacterium]